MSSIACHATTIPFASWNVHFTTMMAALFIMIAASVQDAASRMHIVVQSASVDAAQVFAACLCVMSCMDFVKQNEPLRDALATGYSFDKYAYPDTDDKVQHVTDMLLIHEESRMKVRFASLYVVGYGPWSVTQ